MRLRWGRILAVTAERFDEETMAIVRNLLVYGKLRIGEIVDLFGAQADAARAAAIVERVVSLVRDHFLLPTHPELQIVFADLVAKRLLVSPLPLTLCIWLTEL